MTLSILSFFQNYLLILFFKLGILLNINIFTIFIVSKKLYFELSTTIALSGFFNGECFLFSSFYLFGANHYKLGYNL